MLIGWLIVENDRLRLSLAVIRLGARGRRHGPAARRRSRRPAHCALAASGRRVVLVGGFIQRNIATSGHVCKWPHTHTRAAQKTRTYVINSSLHRALRGCPLSAGCSAEEFTTQPSTSTEAECSKHSLRSQCTRQAPHHPSRSTPLTPPCRRSRSTPQTLQIARMHVRPSQRS